MLQLRDGWSVQPDVVVDGVPNFAQKVEDFWPGMTVLPAAAVLLFIVFVV